MQDYYMYQLRNKSLQPPEAHMIIYEKLARLGKGVDSALIYTETK